MDTERGGGKAKGKKRVIAPPKSASFAHIKGFSRGEKGKKRRSGRKGKVEKIFVAASMKLPVQKGEKKR